MPSRAGHDGPVGICPHLCNLGGKKMKVMYRSGGVAFEPSLSGFEAYVFDDGEYLRSPVTGEEGFDVLGALIEAISPVMGEIEKELVERTENIKKDLKFYSEHKWDTKGKEDELKVVESKLTILRNIKENIKNLHGLIEEYLRTISTDC